MRAHLDRHSQQKKNCRTKFLEGGGTTMKQRNFTSDAHFSTRLRSESVGPRFLGEYREAVHELVASSVCVTALLLTSKYSPISWLFARFGSSWFPTCVCLLCSPLRYNSLLFLFFHLSTGVTNLTRAGWSSGCGIPAMVSRCQLRGLKADMW